MQNRNGISPQTRNNWGIDALLFIGALSASLSGLYFLFLPVGGYQGGRNPMYGIKIIFERATWDDIHTWGGIFMIIAAVVHISIHWSWIKGMVKRVFADLMGRSKHLNNRSRFNSGINALTGISFLFAAISGVYLLFFPTGRPAIQDPAIFFSLTTWDLIHTWSGITMIAAGIIHFAIHWKWVTKVTNRVIRSFLPTKRIKENTNQSNI